MDANNTPKKHTGLIIGLVLLLLLIIITTIIIILLARRRSATTPPTPQYPLGPPFAPGPIAPTPAGPAGPAGPGAPTSPSNRYYFGTDCPSGYTDLGQIGMIADNTTLNELPSSWTAGAAPLPGAPWTFAQPHLCKGDDSLPKDDLYKFSSTADPGNLGLAGILWSNTAAATPFTQGAVFNGDWKWTHPYIVPADRHDGYSITDTGGIGPVGITWNNNDLGNIGTFPKGSPLGATIPFLGNAPWTWVQPNIARN